MLPTIKGAAGVAGPAKGCLAALGPFGKFLGGAVHVAERIEGCIFITMGGMLLTIIALIVYIVLTHH